MSTRLDAAVRAIALLALLAATATAAAETATETPSAAAAASVGLPAVPTVRVLALGRLTPKATPEALRAILPLEVEETVRLQLAGKIDQWFTRKDRPGVVFLINATDPAEARALLDGLALGRAGLMQFDVIPLGPLAPLALLLKEDPH